jgi:hypothetical protein
MLEVEQVLGEIEQPAGFALADRTRRIVDAHEPVGVRAFGVLEDVVEILLMTKQMPHDADRERECLSGRIVPYLLRKAPPCRL